MKLTDFSVDRSITVVVSLLLIVVMGVYALFTIPKETEPELVVPIAMVSVRYEGVSPQDMETHLRSEPFVSQAVVVGDGRKYLTALIALDTEAVEAAIGGPDGHGATEVLATHPVVAREITAAIDRLNAGRAPAERIKDWRILPRELTVAGGELTPTLKVKRSVVIERFGELVEEMYAR